jgi:hypothetical protein
MARQIDSVVNSVTRRNLMIVGALGAVSLVIGALIFGAGPNASAANDYLSPDLRKQVEQLKKDVAANPTTGATLLARTAILWNWGNAFSLTGRPYEPNLPGFVRNVRESVILKEDPDTAPYNNETQASYLDKAVYALSLVDENPAILGTTRINSRGPYIGATMQTIIVTHRLGAGVKTGGGILVGEHPMPDLMRLQTADPAKQNYVTVKSSNPGVAFEAEPYKLGGVYGRMPWGAPNLFKVTRGALKKGDVITITYGDTSGGGPGLQMPTYSNDRIPFQLFVDFDGTKRFLTLENQSIVTIGMEAAGVHGFAPSIVKLGEKVEISVRTQDAFYNRATGPIPAYEIFLNGKKYGDIPAGNDAIHLMKDVTFEKEGVYRFTFKSTDGKIIGEANPILVEADPSTRIYWGETHAHSGMAEGLGTTEQFWAYGRDDARLDFLTHTDHDTSMDDAEWQIVLANAGKFFEEGKFIPYAAWEFSAEYRLGGHHNVLYRTPEKRFLVRDQDYPQVADLHRGLLEHNKAEDVLVIPHAHNPGDWTVSAPSIETLTEIMSGHGTFEWFSQQYLKAGWQVGFVAASDDHINHPGYTSPWHMAIARNQVGGLAAVYAPQKSRDAIFDNLKARRTYATTNERMILKMTVNGAEPGTRAGFSPQRSIDGRIIGTGPIAKIALVKNSETLSVKDFITDKTALNLPAKSLRVQIALFSASTPPDLKHVTPRGPRQWKGKIKVSGARLAEARTIDFDNPRLQGMTKAEDDANALDYHTITRGAPSLIELDLADVTKDAKVTVIIDASKERVAAGGGGLSSEVKGFVELPRQELVLRVADLAGGKDKAPVLHEVPAIEGFTDMVSLRRISTSMPLDTAFTFKDESTGVGDYYYVRVEQSDGAIAWSSPVWIGGKGRE